jgi:hypothetical protein
MGQAICFMPLQLGKEMFIACRTVLTEKIITTKLEAKHTHYSEARYMI